MKIKAILPSIISFLSLASGFFAIREVFIGNIQSSINLIILSCIFDLIDGRIARYYKVSSQSGVLVDSFCDFANFGIASSVIVQIFWNFSYMVMIPCILYTIAIALRLIRFSVNPGNEKNYFTGIPSPISGILILFPIFLADFFNLEKGILLKIFTTIYILFLSMLPFSNIKIISNKSLLFIKNLIEKDKDMKMFGTVGVTLSFIFLIIAGFMFAIYSVLIFYIAFSLYIFYYKNYIAGNNQ